MENTFLPHSIYIKYSSNNQSSIKKIVEINDLPEFLSLWKDSPFKLSLIHTYYQQDGELPIYIITNKPYNSKCLKVHLEFPLDINSENYDNQVEYITMNLFHIYYLYINQCCFRSLNDYDQIEKHFIGLELSSKNNRYSIAFLLDGQYRAEAYASLYRNRKSLHLSEDLASQYMSRPL